MEINIELRADHLNATLIGPLSLEELPRAFETAYDAAFDQGLRRILIDCSGLDGAIPTKDRFLLGKSGIAYWSSRSWKMIPKIAVVGEAPLIDGFAALVASSGGVNARTFSGVQEALNWLGIR
jgi:stage II sporulation SpoAA-like protein